MEARIFMKFYVVVNYYLVSLSLEFHEDLCINARTTVVNARARTFYRECARLRLVCAHLCTNFYETKNFSSQDSN